MTLPATVRRISTLVILAGATTISAVGESLSVDSCVVAQEGASVLQDVSSNGAQKRNIVQKVINYFSESNTEKPDKDFDISVIGGPSYSAATSVELAALVSGIYRSRKDSLTPRSDLTVFAEGSVTGFYNVGVKGHHIFPADKMRIEYNANFCHFPLKFWGLGYDNAVNKANESEYTLLESAFTAKFLWKLPHNIYIGPSADFNYQKATKVERPELWDGQDLRVFCYGLGVVFSFDTRDLPTNASKGYYIGLHQQFFPKFMGNDYAFSMTDVSAMYYHKFWSSGIMAFRLHAASAYGNVPWGMMPTLEDGNAVRGYYEGRYRDENEADLVVELRQHVWRRNGIVVWGGVGTVFSKLCQVQWNRLLPTCGIGYRWEFKNRVNVRVDFGIGKHSTTVNVGINESF
jgi:hypothetical protein